MLTVRESQVAILVNEGRIADVYQPGLYKLETTQHAGHDDFTELAAWLQ